MARMDTLAASASVTFFFMAHVDATDQTQVPPQHRPTSTGALTLVLTRPNDERKPRRG